TVIRKIFYRDGHQVENRPYRQIYPISERIRKPRIGAVTAILCEEILLTDGSTLSPSLRAKICRLLLEGIPRQQALSTGWRLCRERGELSEWQRMRTKLYACYDIEGFRTVFDGSSNTNTDSESNSPNSLKRAGSVDDARETASRTKRIKAPQSQARRSTNPPSQMQTIKATRVSVRDPAEDEGEALRTGRAVGTINISTHANSDSSSPTVSTSQAETSSQLLPSSSAADKVTTPNSRETFPQTAEGSNIGTP